MMSPVVFLDGAKRSSRHKGPAFISCCLIRSCSPAERLAKSMRPAVLWSSPRDAQQVYAPPPRPAQSHTPAHITNNKGLQHTGHPSLLWLGPGDPTLTHTYTLTLAFTCACVCVTENTHMHAHSSTLFTQGGSDDGGGALYLSGCLLLNIDRFLTFWVPTKLSKWTD